MEYDINIMYMVLQDRKSPRDGANVFIRKQITLMLDIMNIFPHGSKPARVNN